MKKWILIATLSALAASAQTQTQTLDPEMQAKVLKGLQIAPVPLNMVGLDPVLVGYGSYLVNATAGCNDCHQGNPQQQWAAGGNPYFGQHATLNQATYLGGGRDFGAFPSSTGNFPHIISRNLTPDGSGMPAGGMSLSQFTQVLRTGVDFDKVHPTCTGAPDGNCLPAPFNGALLQIMPWPSFSNLTDRDIQAIYTYMTAVPCLEGGPGEPANRCAGAFKTMAVASPKNATVTAHQYQLDGTKSSSSNGGPLTYQWSIPQGGMSAAILQGNTATPIVQFGLRGTYMFQLTVTDSAGNQATDIATIDYQGR
ncbi:MAG: PKD domain-containing protein [Acidobacteriia bacterium]|nr:PKD domain-containing protein [Terriglobia bacterium]